MFLFKLMINLLLSLFIGYATANNQEIELRNHLMTDYNKYVRPVEEYSDTLDVRMGLAVQNIEEFDQMKETLDLNIWVRMEWENHLLKWDNSVSNLTFLSIDSSTLWVPDIELLNAASTPDIYILNQGMNLYQSGAVFRSLPGIFKFSCTLSLQDFPFDTQSCTMRFGSWTYYNELMNVLPYENDDKQLDVLDSFSHSEWDIVDYYVENTNETRVCCPGKNFSVNEYTFQFQRYPHYYKLSMGMTISLVLVSFIIMLIKSDNVSRTGTAVFIPLTILALQLTIADKIPVVGYYTLMDNFFLCCFITSMICSIESGIIFALVTSKSNTIYRIFNRIFNFDRLYKNYKTNISKSNKRNAKHEIDLKQTIETCNGDDTKSIDIEHRSSDEFKFTISNLNAVGNKSSTDCEDNSRKNTSADGENNSSENTSADDRDNSSASTNDEDNFTVVDKNVVKVISFDDKNLNISFKEKLVFDEVRRVFEIVDNIFRVLLPFIFFIYIIVLMSNEK
jgi:hypothetical protein